MTFAEPIEAAKVFQALGDPTRRAIVERLSKGPASVSSLAEPLGVTLTAVTQHLRVLEDCGLARTHKAGRVRTCEVSRAGFGVLEHWIGWQRSLWETRLDALGVVLAED